MRTLCQNRTFSKIVDEGDAVERAAGRGLPDGLAGPGAPFCRPDFVRGRRVEEGHLAGVAAHNVHALGVS